MPVRMGVTAAALLVLVAAVGVLGVQAAGSHALRGGRDAAATAVMNDRPIIGILTIPVDDGPFSDQGTSYFAASYVKWIESGGARVVPVRYDDGPESIKEQMKSLNGLLWTGGGTNITDGTPDNNLTTWGKAALATLEAVQEASANGEHVPLWCTCQGFETLHVLVGEGYGPGSSQVLDYPFDSENITLALDLTPDAKNSRMFGGVPEVLEILSTQNVTMNNHQMGISPGNYKNNSKLSSTFRVLSTNVDRNGKPFISTVEGIDLPIYATQWHPEKVQFEWWSDEVMNHSVDSTFANSYPARWLGAEARRNSRSFANPEDEQKALIYNYDPVFTGPQTPFFEQTYFFTPSSKA